MKKPLTQTNLLQILASLFVACLLISNVLAAKTFEIGNIVLTTGVIIFPITYIVNDVLAEIYGYKKARKIILLGFALNLLAVAAYTIAIALPTPAFAAEGAAAFKLTLGSTWRVLIASVSAYLIGSLLNAKIMELMKKRLSKYLMLRCIGSTLVGEGVDAFIFVIVVFYGTAPAATLATMIIAQAAIKTAYEIICYPVTKQVIKKVNSLPA